MSDKPPILDYETPEKPQEKKPRVLRILAGVIIAPAAMLFLLGAVKVTGLDYFVERNPTITKCIAGTVCVIIAYFVGRRVGRQK